MTAPMPSHTAKDRTHEAHRHATDHPLAVLPKKLKGGAAKAVVTKLLDQGLLKEVRVKRGEPHWRVDENERPIGLKLTRSGQSAIRVEEGADAEEAPARKGSRRAEKASAKAREVKAVPMPVRERAPRRRSCSRS